MKETTFTKILNIICRWIVGCVFLFSSFVKGVDPFGTAYKIQDYMLAWNIGSITFEWALPLAPLLSITLITLEFLVGVLLITGTWRKGSAWLLVLMMIFFTVTTLIDAITNKVTDCGCFGDAVKLTNWQTFWKNIILDVPTLFIFLCRNWKGKRRFEHSVMVISISIIAMILFCLWNIKNEPCIDFRPWKVGNTMIDLQNTDGPQSFVTYRDNTTGEEEEISTEQLMQNYQDSLWVATHEFVTSRVVDPNEIKADGFSMLAPDGEDYATAIIGDENYTVIATIHSLSKMDRKEIGALKMVHNFCNENNLHLVLLTSALTEEVEQFLYEQDLSDLEYYFADATAIKTMLRSNPGFLLTKEARVVKKWSTANATKIQDFPFEIE